MCRRCAPRRLLFPLALLAALAAPAPAQRCAGHALSAELFTGSAWSVPLPLDVRLPGGGARIRARYATRPFSDAPYYSYRLARSAAGGAGVEAEMLHHKLYLLNPMPPVERFEVTHGYNLPMVNVAGPGAGWQLRVGMGFVVAHPEGRIAGRELAGIATALGGGYHIAGPTMQVALGRRYPLAHGRTAMVAAPEAKLTASWARVRFRGGTVVVPNAAVHLLGGLGVRRCA